MEALIICLIILLIILFIYLASSMIFVYIINKKVFGVRGKDPDNPCYLTFDDYKDVLNREKFRTGFYNEVIDGYIYTKKEMKEFKGFIILSHGFFGSHIQYLIDISLLCENGYKVLAFDQYGVSLSDGKNQVSLSNGVYVLENVINHVIKNKLNDDLPIYLYGHSWGGYCSYAALKKYPQIKKAVIRNGFVSPIKVTLSLVKKQNKFIYYYLLPVYRIIYFITYTRRNCISALRGNKNKTTKVLIIQSKDDSMVEYKYSLAYYFSKHNRHNVSLYVTENGGHNTLITEQSSKNYIDSVNKYNDILKSNESEETKKLKIEEFTSSLERLKMYSYREDVCNEIINFLKN